MHIRSSQAPTARTFELHGDIQLSYSHNSRFIFEIEQFDAFGSFVFSPSKLTGEQTEVECRHKFVMSPTLRAFCASKQAATG